MPRTPRKHLLKEVRTVVLISTRGLTRDKERPFVQIKGSTHPEDTGTLNSNAPDTKATKDAARPSYQKCTHPAGRGTLRTQLDPTAPSIGCPQLLTVHEMSTMSGWVSSRFLPGFDTQNQCNPSHQQAGRETAYDHISG